MNTEDLKDKRDELIDLLMDYLRALTFKVRPSDAELNAIPEVAYEIRQLLNIQL